jgi:serine protease Do
MPRRRSPRLLAAFCITALLSPAVFADNAKPNWDPARVSAPEDVKELRALQDTVKLIVDKVTPATVGVLLGMGAGSGVIVSPDGLVLTAAHVIEPPTFFRRGESEPRKKTVSLFLADGTIVKAEVLGRNPRIDSGMVKITDPVPKDAKWPGAKDGKWPFAEVADSSAVKKGQWVVSLGHPGGPKKERRAPLRLGQIQKTYFKEKVLVSDCALVGGDSGGPLFDLTGKVIGIHSRIGLSMEDNIHIPTQAFKDEWEELVAGKVIRGPIKPYLGVVLNREGKGEPKIETVVEDTPAAKAGLEEGDVILKFNGEQVHTSDDVDNLVQAAKPGDKVKLEIQRGEEIKELTVTLGRLVPEAEADKKKNDGEKK